MSAQKISDIIISGILPNPKTREQGLYSWLSKFAAELDQFLKRIKTTLNLIIDGDIATLHLTNQLTEPAIKPNGMIVYTDATGWNPGGGAGIYGRIGDSWIKLN